MGVCLRSPIYIFIFTIIWQKIQLVWFPDFCVHRSSFAEWELEWGRVERPDGDGRRSAFLQNLARCLFLPPCCPLSYLAPRLGTPAPGAGLLAGGGRRQGGVLLWGGRQGQHSHCWIPGTSCQNWIRPVFYQRDLMSGAWWRGWDDIRAGHQLQVALPSRSSARCRVQEVRRDA